MLLDYEMHAKNWILKNVEVLNTLWNHRDYAGRYADAFENDASVKVTWGMTRIVIIGKDFVIKIDKPILAHWRIFGTSRNEVRMYKKAVVDGYDWLFARIRAMIIEHHTYYIMQKVDCTAEDAGYCEIEDFYEYLGEETMNYIEENVFDIHNENFGLIDGEPIIFDYAANHC